MSPIAITTSAGVTEWVLNAEPCNELGTTLLAALEDALAELETAIGAGESRALIIRSENPRGFSAGADLRELSEGFETRPEAEHAPALRAFIERIHKLLDRLDMLPITTIAVIHGVCFGGGLELALTCDLRIVERSARLAFPELRLGIIPGFGGIPRLERETSPALVRDLILSGRSINARKAVETGFACAMAPPGKGARQARAMAEQCARYDPAVTGRAKAFMKRLPVERLAEERELFLDMALATPRLREALRAFVASDDLRPYLG